MIETFAQALPADIHIDAERVMQAICAAHIRLALAESCTGGLLAAVLTDIEGSAHGFDRSFVTYTDDAKATLLGVPQAVLRESGAVSAACAEAMAQGALQRSEADLALSITGFAGPAGPGDEAGLVFFGLARPAASHEVIERHYGPLSRAQVRLACLRQALDLLEAAL